MNYFELGKGIEFFSSYDDEERKFNEFTIFFFIKRTCKKMILAQMLKCAFEQYKQENIDFFRDIYDASLGITCEVREDKIYIGLNILVLNDKYAFEPNENLLNKALEFLCNMILSLNTPDKNRYYSVIREVEDEIQNDEDDKENYIKRAFANLFPDSYVAINALNSLPKLDDISYNTFAKFQEEFLTSSNILVFGRGVYDEKAVYEYLKERFSEIKNRRGTNFKSTFDFHTIKKETICKKTAYGDSSCFVTFLWLGNRQKIKNYNSLTYLYSVILQKVLFNVVREERGLVYAIFAQPYIKYSALAIHGNINEHSYNEVVECVKNPEILSLNVYSDKELEEKLQYAKIELKSTLKRSIFWDFSGYIYYIYQNNFYEDDIDGITVQDVREYAKTLAKNSQELYGSYLETPSTSNEIID